MVLIQFPPKSTEWLKVLADDGYSNLTFIPNLSLDAKKLGFSLRTNQHGYRGEFFSGQKYTCLGTSFGAAVGVSDEEAWFNNVCKGVCNLSFPCSNQQHLDRVKEISGKRDTLIYIYHPNVLITSLSFFNHRLVGGSYFDYMGWKVRLSPYDYSKFFVKLLSKILSRRVTFRFSKYKLFMLDRKYCKSSYPISFVNQEAGILNEIFSLYRKVYVVRVPIREEIGLSIESCYFDNKWNDFCSLSSKPDYIDLKSFFELSDYHSLDNHWNVSGNSKFSDLIDRFVLSKQAD
jgi:hypothetical protein